MAIHITASGAAAIPASAGILIQVNAALTGTITVTDTSATQAVITNPTVGQQYVYYGCVGNFSVNPSATCDISVSVLSRSIY